MFQLVLLKLAPLVSGIILAQLFSMPSEFVLAQSNDKVGDVMGNVVNSKYVAITDHRYQHGNFSDVITGTLINNSTQQIPVISVVAALYDKDDKLITTGISSADASDLPGGDNSAFSISLFGLGEDVVDHYTLFPGGTP
jgi:hypothetical protein